MDYLREVGSRSFWDTWDLVFNRSLASGMIGVAIFASTLVYLRSRKRHKEAKQQLKDVGIAASITGAAFVIVFLFHFLILTPKALIEENQAAKRTAESALSRATPVPLQFEVTETDAQARAELATTKAQLEKAEAKIRSLDPLEQPIASARITVSVSIPANKGRTPSELVGQGGIVWLSRGVTALLSANAGDHSIDDKGNISFVADCLPDNPYMGKPIKRLTDAEYIQVAFGQEYMPINSVVDGGKVTVVVNNQVTLNFTVPPQTMSMERKFGRMATLMFITDLKDGLTSLRQTESP